MLIYTVHNSGVIVVADNAAAVFRGLILFCLFVCLAFC